MSLFDLIFLAFALSTAIVVFVFLVALVRRRWGTVRRLGIAWVIFAIAYLAASFVVSYVRPQHIVAIGDPWCFDDWCLTAEKVTIVPGSAQSRYQVELRISSRAGRVTQRAKGAWIYLIDERGHLYDPKPDASQVPLDAVLSPQQSVLTSRVFDVPNQAHTIGLITGHGGPYCGTMSVLVIGDGGCWFQKPPMIRIQ